MIKQKHVRDKFKQKMSMTLDNYVQKMTILLKWSDRKETGQ